MTIKDALENRNASDYGMLDLEVCDVGLRQRVIGLINPSTTEATTLDDSQRAEIATYITQLEDALLRHHWGVMDKHRIHEILKCSTGLDMEMLSQALASMTAVDA